MCDESRILLGRDFLYEELLGLRFKISPFSFFQTNSFGAEVLYETARAYVGETKDKVIYDLYSGTGTIAQILAPVAKKVVGVEIVEEAVEAAKVNAGLNQLDNCDFHAGDVLKVIDELSEVPDLIVLDPPETVSIPKPLKKSSASEWNVWYIFPVNLPASQETWSHFKTAVIRWKNAAVLIFFRQLIMWRQLFFLSQKNQMTR